MKGKTDKKLRVLNINFTILMISIISIVELIINSELEYSLFLWILYGIWRFIEYGIKG